MELDDLKVRRPTLEDVYRKLIANNRQGSHSHDPHPIPRPYVPLLATPPCGPAGSQLTMFLLLEYLLRLWREHKTQAADDADLGLRITYLPSEAGQDTYQDFAVPINGQARG